MKKYKSVIGELELVKQKQAEENQKHINDIAAMQAQYRTNFSSLQLA